MMYTKETIDKLTGLGFKQTHIEGQYTNKEMDVYAYENEKGSAALTFVVNKVKDLNKEDITKELNRAIELFNKVIDIIMED